MHLGTRNFSSNIQCGLEWPSMYFLAPFTIFPKINTLPLPFDKGSTPDTDCH